MGVLSWARELVTSPGGEVPPIPVRIDDDCLIAGVNGGAARIPVERRPNTSPHPILKEIHSCEVAGRRLEAESAEALRRKVAAMLEGIAPAQSLPLAYFRAPAASYELPVYEDDGQIVAHALGRPRSRARDLAGIRAHVSRHLTSAGYVSTEDDLQVGLVDGADLSLIEPAAVFRSLRDPQLWIPWTDRHDAAAPRLDQLGLDARASDHDVLSLLAWLRRELAGGQRDGLYAAAVRPDAWAAAMAGARPRGLVLVADLEGGADTRLELPVARTGDGALACALDCGGIDAFLEPSPDALATAVGQRLHQLGFARSPGRVTVADSA